MGLDEVSEPGSIVRRVTRGPGQSSVGINELYWDVHAGRNLEDKVQLCPLCSPFCCGSAGGRGMAGTGGAGISSEAGK